jgi:SAM-dependent methyltransferase
MHPPAPFPNSEAVPFELEVLVNANRYQKWLVDVVRPYLGKRVLELGSGIGNMSRHLPLQERLVFSEISPALIKILESRIPQRPGQSITLVDPSIPLHQTFLEENFDTVLSFNVLEHIEDDAGMLRDLITLLQNSNSPGTKRIVTVVPAHQWAYGEVDKSFEHFRRYSASSFRKTLRNAGVTELHRKNFRFRYLNLPGLLGWWLNGKLLGRKKIGTGNVKLFEILCPLIRPADDFLHRQLRFPMGNSLLAVYVVPPKT